MKQIDIDRLAGEILRLDREVEGLATAGRLFIGQQVRMIGHIYEEIVKPQIIGSEEACEMERIICRWDVL